MGEIVRYEGLERGSRGTDVTHYTRYGRNILEGR